MITKTEADQIKQILGRHYTALVQEELIKLNAVNKKGDLHSANQIRGVMCGNSNTIIEQAIFNAVETKQNSIEKEKAKRNKILTKKTVAATTD